MAGTATVTVLFTDLVDSTGLLRHGPEAADEIRRAHLAALRRGVADHGGTEVKSTGDGLMVVFPSTADSVRCAVAMQQAIAALRRSDSRMPAIRVGVSVGEASLEDGDYYGPPVIEAARLCAAADGGQILAAEVVMALAGSRAGTSFVPLGELSLKGFDEPVRVAEVPWAPNAAAQSPLPPALELVETGWLAGRAREYEELADAWKRAQAGERRVVLVAGEPGIGKTRLVGELARDAHADGAAVLWGRCDEELAVGYQPLVEALGHHLRHAPAELLEAVPELGELTRIVPALGERVPGLAAATLGDPDLERQRLFEAIASLLRHTADAAPVLLVIDDLHWAPKPTLLALRHLVRDATPAAILVAATYRDTDLDRAHPLAGMLADLRREPAVTRLALSGLDVDGVAGVVESLAGHDLDERGWELVRAVHGETEGNPFFVGQVLRHLAETGALYQKDGRWQSDLGVDQLGIPEGVREVVGRRLSRLSEAANRALAVAAIVGREFDLRTLELVPDAGDDPDALLAALEEAATARLVDEVAARPGAFSFGHALVRQTLLAEMSAVRRARLHARVGAALASLPDGTVEPAVLAHHFCEGAVAGAIERAVHWTEAAADVAHQRMAFEEAVSTIERALQVVELEDPPDVELRGRLRVALARELIFSGDHDRSRSVGREATDDARTSGSAALLADAANVRFTWGQAGIPHEEAVPLLEEALSALGHTDPQRRARVLRTLALYRATNEGQGVRALPYAEEAAELLRAEGPRTAADREELAEALGLQAIIMQASPDVERALRLVEEMVELGADVAPGGPRALFDVGVLRITAVLAVQLADRDRFGADVEAMSAVGREHGGFVPLAMASMWRGMEALADGRFEDAEAAAAGILEHSVGDANFVNSWAAQLFYTRREQGRLAEVMDLLRSAVDQTPGLIALQTNLALALADLGDLDGAREIFDRLAPDGFSVIPRDSTVPASLVNLTVVCARLRDRSAAESLHGLLLPYSGQLLVIAWGVGCLGAADRYLAMLDAILDRPDEADRRFAAAAALEERFSAPPLAARTRTAWAQALLERGAPGDEARAAGLLAEAAEVAERLGMAGLAAEIAALRGT